MAYLGLCADFHANLEERREELLHGVDGVERKALLELLQLRDRKALLVEHFQLLQKGGFSGRASAFR